jgi:UDP-sulfoquinovose synthase
VSGLDNGLRRRWVEEMGSHSALPIVSLPERAAAFASRFGVPLRIDAVDLCDARRLDHLLANLKPQAIVHLAECPSAPYSMIDAEHAAFVQRNNIIGTLNLLFAIRERVPDAHLLKLGTMGEYGTPNLDIPEGFFEVEYRGRRDRLPFPRQAGSWYHWSKVHDSNNVMFACRIWGLRSTDVMQGVVYGTRVEEMEEDPRFVTRLDFDQAFGTAINRFCCQAVIGEPLSLFGGGGQRRGFLPLRDSMQCLTLALENPPEPGEYRVFNQFEDCYTVAELAQRVVESARRLGILAEVCNLENPRYESEQHHYRPDRERLLALGYRPTRDMASELDGMIADLARYRDRIVEKRASLVPDIRWDGRRRVAQALSELVGSEST